MDDPEIDDVCPARAGMIRNTRLAALPNRGLPRTRGDDPHGTARPRRPILFAPHARG